MSDANLLKQKNQTVNINGKQESTGCKGQRWNLHPVLFWHRGFPKEKLHQIFVRLEAGEEEFQNGGAQDNANENTGVIDNRDKVLLGHIAK